MKQSVKMTVKRVETDRPDYHQVYGYSYDPTQEMATYDVPLDSNRLCGFKNDYGEGKSLSCLLSCNTMKTLYKSKRNSQNINNNKTTYFLKTK